MNNPPSIFSLLFLEQASTIAPRIDAIYFGLIAITVVFCLIVGVSIVALAFKYRRKSADQVGTEVPEHLSVEIIWSVIPLIISLGIFFVGAKVFLESRQIPPGSLEISIVAKQWMWKAQHPDGMREINELHVPKGRPVHLRMISQDVIHSFFVPAFRVKQDVLPMYFTSLWFEATKTGIFKLHCSVYCGKDHSVMGGKVIVLEPAEYEKWLNSGTGMLTPLPMQAGVLGAATDSIPVSTTPLKGNAVAEGQKLFEYFACATCHHKDQTGQCPTLYGVYGSKVALQDGSTVLADDNYLRESILNPLAKIVAGYPPVMPNFSGRVSEEQILQLLAYIKSLRGSK